MGDSRMKWYVYMYSDPDTNIPFYVGKGRHNRSVIHLRLKGNNKRLIGKLYQLREAGKRPLITHESYHDEEMLSYNAEQDLIKKIGRIEDGGTLLNIVLGGLGVKSLVQKNNPRVVEAARRNAISVNQNKQATAKKIAFLDKYNKLPETSAMRSKITTVLHEDPERHKAMLAGLAKGNTPEMWAARTAKMRALYADPVWNRNRVEKQQESRRRNLLSKQEKM
jgi:hypothetical protein